MKKLISWMSCAAGCGVFASMAPAFAQGTAFTYQGRLNNNGSPVSGQYDLRFALYTNISGGSAVFGPLTNAAISVSNGLFVTTLDFGTGVFNGPTYWLDIAARTNGTGAFDALVPRQQLTPGPYAIYASNAGIAASASSVAAANITGTISVGQLSSAVVTNNEANVALNGAFSGNGSSLSNVPLSGLASYGSLTLASNGLDFVFTAAPVVGLEPIFVTAATNLNGAGHMDLACANFGSNSITVLTNNGSGQFSTEATLTVATNPFCVAVTDVNNDGRPDLVCGYYSPLGPGTNIVTVLTNNGAGGFVFNANLTVGLDPTCVIAADVNGDGKPDLISANFGTNTLTVLTNNGHGGFVLSTTLRVGATPAEVVAADLIGNGRQDLVCANYGTNTLSVLINNGNGTFLPTTYTVGNAPRSLQAADVNGDGLLDLVCINQDGSALSVLTNNGDGTFTTANTITTLTNVGYLTVDNMAVADLNGDGKPDLIFATGTVLVFMLNTGNGTFGPPVPLLPNVAASGFYSVAAADVNGDGRPDLVATASNTNALAILINANGQPSSELTLPGQSGGLRLFAGLNGSPNIIGGSSANVVDPGVDDSSIAGGGSVQNPNQVSANQSAISGGEGNVIQAFADHSNIGGGFLNLILPYSSYAAIGGGLSNTVGGFCATVPGGYSNLASGAYSFAAGHSAQATNQGSFVWADSASTPFDSTANDQFSVRATGGARFVTGSAGTIFAPGIGSLAIVGDSGVAVGVNVTGGTTAGHVRLRNGMEVWPNNSLTLAGYLDVRNTSGTANVILDGATGNITNSGNVYAHGVQLTSDRNAKENFSPVNAASVLETVAALPVAEWNYKGDGAQIRHMGPMAQDFSAAFSLNGKDDKHISVGDQGGVALAAIQGLNQKLEAELSRRDAENAQLKSENKNLQRRLKRLEQAVESLAER